MNTNTTNASKLMASALLTMLLLATWTLLHHYKGLTQDGELYAFQAMAKLNPALRADVYLSGNSQDDFTLFSSLYARCISMFGLWYAGIFLFAFCAAAFYAAAWSVARRLWDGNQAWLAAAMCITITCGYGAYGVFHYSENYLTARSLAEAMVIMALACHLWGLTRLSWTIAVASIFIHPLMALPGILLLICLTLPLVYACVGAIAGVVGAAILAWIAFRTSHQSPLLEVMSGQWLEMVQQRSQFLFLQDWRAGDWEGHARSLICLGIAASAAERAIVRRLCFAASLVGVAGLIVALIASTIGPVAILLQGQAWRWFWITGFVSVLTLVPSAICLWRSGGCGAICAVLLIASWTFPPVNGTYTAAAALGLWCVRIFVQAPTQKLLQILAYIFVAAILAWTIANIWAVCTLPTSITTEEAFFFERLRSIYALQLPGLVIISLVLAWLRSGMNCYASGLTISMLLLLCVYCIPGSFKRNSMNGTRTAIESMSPWRAAIPPTSSVLMVPSMKSAGFIWFSLQRPSYLTVSQSAGVVFSSKTAQEIRRRSEVLQPIADPDWRIMSELAQAGRKGEAPGKAEVRTRPLTAEMLHSICGDPLLGFVMAKERLAFDAISGQETGEWKNWNLYDCRKVRQRGLAG